MFPRTTSAESTPRKSFNSDERSLCPLYGSERGCKWGDKCWDDHSNPNHVPFCADFRTRDGCPYGTKCYYRHHFFPNTQSKNAPWSYGDPWEDEVSDVNSSTNSVRSVQSVHSSGDSPKQCALPEIMEIHPVSIPLSAVPTLTAADLEQSPSTPTPDSFPAQDPVIEAMGPVETDHVSCCNPLNDDEASTLVDKLDILLEPEVPEITEPSVYSEDSTSILEKGTKCLLCNLMFSSTMNGSLCKIVGSYREDEGRYPVYVYKTKETAMIKAENLKPIRTKCRKVKKMKKAKIPLTMTVHQKRELVAETIIFQKRNIQRVNSAKLFAESMVRADPHRNLFLKTELNDDLQMLLNGNCHYIKQFISNQHNLTLFQMLQADLGAERFYGFLDRDIVGKTKSNLSLSGSVALEKSKTYRMIIQKMADHFGVEVKSCGLNLYQTGRDYVPFHHDTLGRVDDDEGYMTIGASFGAERSLDFLHIGETEYQRKQVMANRTGHHYKPMKERFSLPQHNGDVFAFSSKMNRLFRHSVPKVDDRKIGPRFSVMLWGKKKENK